MSIGFIILICIVGIIWFLGFLVCFLFFIFGWTEDKKLQWKFLLTGIFFPCFVLYDLWLGIYFYYNIVQQNGGIISHIRYRKECKRREIENKRIEDAYKRGEIRRDELPRQWCDGIRNFELRGELFGQDRHDLVYIENERNKTLNNFFERHANICIGNGYRVVYLPAELRRLANEDITRYWSPKRDKTDVEFSKIDSTYLLKELYYPQDAQNLHHGIMSCSGMGENHSAKYLHGTYYPLTEGTDEDILSQIEAIANEIEDLYTTGLNCSVEIRRPSLDNPTEDLADEQHLWEITELIEEVKERVEKLKQYGISRNLLEKLIAGEQQLSRLVVTKDLHIILPDYNNMEINMEPINKAVYLLFLRHPEGIIFKHLPDYRKELADIYQRIKPWGLNERALRSIEDVTNPFLNSINEKCARIRGAFISQFDEKLAKHYYIYGERGEAKKIALPRELVVWE